MKKILIIEDNLEVRENTAEILELAGFEVITAVDGREGVDLAKNKRPDLIICDIMMPVLDGYGVLYILAKEPTTSTIPFIFLTAKADKSDFRKGMSMGADDYITKPFSETDLLNAVELRLKKSEHLREASKPDQGNLNKLLAHIEDFDLVRELSEGRKVKSFPRKSTIYYEGDYPNYLYYIEQGKVKTFKINEDGKEFITGIYSKGDFIGYMELLKDAEHTDSAQTLENSEIYLIPKQDFQAMVFENREISAHFIKLLSGNLIEREKQLLALAYDTVRKRVADALLKIQSKFTEENKENFSISREDIANMVGTATESVIRSLSEFKKDNVIQIESNKIKILDLKALKEIKF